MQFGLMRTVGFSMRQLITLVWLEQAIVIGAGMALGAEMGRRLGAIIMPFLSHNDRGTQVLPPFVLEIDWGTLAITYGFIDSGVHGDNTGDDMVHTQDFAAKDIAAWRALTG